MLEKLVKLRIDVVSLEKNVSFDQVLNLIVSSSYSRIPVYEHSFDNIHGVLYIKDLIPHISSKNLEWYSMCQGGRFLFLKQKN